MLRFSDRIRIIILFSVWEILVHRIRINNGVFFWRDDLKYEVSFWYSGYVSFLSIRNCTKYFTSAVVHVFQFLFRKKLLGKMKAILEIQLVYFNRAFREIFTVKCSNTNTCIFCALLVSCRITIHVRTLRWCHGLCLVVGFCTN